MSDASLLHERLNSVNFTELVYSFLKTAASKSCGVIWIQIFVKIILKWFKLLSTQATDSKIKLDNT